mgnify:CR=1 FL=1
MYGQTRLGIFGITLTSVLLIIYRVMYYDKLYNIPQLLPVYNFLHAFVLVFAFFLSFSLIIVLARAVKNFIVEVVLFFIIFALISVYAVGFTGIP